MMYTKTHLTFQLTAARRRLAGVWMMQRRGLSFNSQPPEGGWLSDIPKHVRAVRFNSQPPEGGWFGHGQRARLDDCFNSQPPEGGWHQK